ncbi:hypothetical protein [Bradyrhizobium sp.]|uniref:hypothetical protein n=1 Tax=Bradyrhizobium sp. TaxID=376 RepID=UPI001EC10A05|nr:hypothetical protein [Bradyrhizobium sp.]MBV8923099.1 hypothetical protein [Bradyrhizobium sp.]MBV9983182.1 hypothetical protein [Bradyrhizobium sp.]
MSTNDTYLAVFLASKTSPKVKAWEALPESERQAKQQQGIAAWHAWADRHKGAIVEMGGPLGKTRKVDSQGIGEISNSLTAFTVVRADSHEAAAKMFEGHPHFAIFPGESIEIMPILPIPGR